MPPFTKRAIVETFLDIAAKKPFEKITVRDLVDKCGLNRNTFYYYFQDIYGVLEAVFLGETLFFSEETAPLDGLYELLLFTEKQHRAMQSIYVSLGGDGISKYLFQPIEASFLSYLARKGEEDGVRPLLARAVTHAVIGLYLDYLRGGCREAPDAVLGDCRILLGRFFPEAL